MCSEFYQCFRCVEKEDDSRRYRPKIDRSMIGNPTNFVHTGHIGGSGEQANISMTAAMSGKGGYAESAPQFSVLKLIDLKELQDQRCATTSATVTAAPSSQGESMAQSKDPAEQAQPSDVDQPARTSVG